MGWTIEVKIVVIDASFESANQIPKTRFAMTEP
jgi:hypothetical protein